jgi:hypothetical protein
MFKRFLLVVCLSIEATSFNSIRAMTCAQYDVNDSLASRMSKSNYNYVIVSFNFRISDEMVGNGDVYENLSSDIRKATITLSKYNIKIIPMISMSSKWAIQWKILQKYENPKIGMNTIVSDNKAPNVIANNAALYNLKNTLQSIGGEGKKNGSGNYISLCELDSTIEKANMGSNSWAYEAEGVDKSVIDIFNAIKDGFSNALVDYGLEYIHIQHDEAQFLNWSLIGGIGAKCGNALPYAGNFARGEVSDADVAYINNAVKSGLSLEAAHQNLLADEIYRRVIQCESIFGSKVRVMFYAEVFDDQSWGGVPWNVQDGNKVSKILMCNAITLPGLNEEQKRKVKEQVIPMIWNYDGKVSNVERVTDWFDIKDYDSESAFNRFSNNGYNFLYVGALQHGESSKNQIKEYASASKNRNCLGYCGAAWDVSYDINSPDLKWSIIEYLPSFQKREKVKSYVLNNVVVDIAGRKVSGNKSSGVYISRVNNKIIKTLDFN